MPPPVWNPDWTPDNGKPKWISYDDLGPRGVPQDQPNSARSTRSVQPLLRNSDAFLVDSDGRPRLANPMPKSAFTPAKTVTPAELMSPKSDEIVPSEPIVRHSSGTPANTAALPNIATTNHTAISQHSISGPNIAGIEASNDIHTTSPVSGMENEDHSWQATLQQTRKLLRLRDKRYGRHVKSFEDHERFKKARKHLLRKNTVDRSEDMPQDPAGQQALVARLVNAMSNLDGIETRQTRKQSTRQGGTRIIDSVGVKCVKDMGGFEMEMLAWDFMLAVRDAQRGHLELQAKFKFRTYDTFMERFDDLESCLRFNKQLIRSAIQSTEWIDRIAAHPREERSRKKTNERINANKCEAITLARQLTKDGATGSATKRQPSTDPLEKSRMMLSVDEHIHNQPQSQLEQPRPVRQQYQLPQEQGMQPQVFEGPQQSPQQLPQQPPQQLLDYSQHVNIQPQHVAIHLYYPNPEQYWNPQQLADPQPSETYVQIEDREGMEQSLQHHGGPEQHAGDQEIDNSLHFENLPQGETPRPFERPQQHGNPEQQAQQPAAAQEPVGTSAASPFTFDGPQSP